MSGLGEVWHHLLEESVCNWRASSRITTDYGEDAVSIIPPARNLNLFMIFLALAVGAAVVWVVRGINQVLSRSIVELGDGADQVTTAVRQVSSSSQSLAPGASEQVASLEETSASSEEINSMARRNTDNSKATVELLGNSQEKVGQAHLYLEEMGTSMELIFQPRGDRRLYPVGAVAKSCCGLLGENKARNECLAA